MLRDICQPYMFSRNKISWRPTNYSQMSKSLSTCFQVTASSSSSATSHVPSSSQRATGVEVIWCFSYVWYDHTNRSIYLDQLSWSAGLRLSGSGAEAESMDAAMAAGDVMEDGRVEVSKILDLEGEGEAWDCPIDDVHLFGSEPGGWGTSRKLTGSYFMELKMDFELWWLPCPLRSSAGLRSENITSRSETCRRWKSQIFSWLISGNKLDLQMTGKPD